MITLVVKRRRPILGEIKDGKLVPTQLGAALLFGSRDSQPDQFAS